MGHENWIFNYKEPLRWSKFNLFSDAANTDVHLSAKTETTKKLGKLGKRGKLTRTLEYRNWENSGFGQKRFYSLNTTFGSFVSLFYVQQELCSRKFRRSWYQNKNRWTKCSESEHIKLYSNILNLIKRIIRSKQFACRFLIRETLGKPNGLFEIRDQQTKIFDSPPVVDRAVGGLLFECII